MDGERPCPTRVLRRAEKHQKQREEEQEAPARPRRASSAPTAAAHSMTVAPHERSLKGKRRLVVSGEAYLEAELEIAQPEFKANFELKDHFYQVSLEP